MTDMQNASERREIHIRIWWHHGGGGKRPLKRPDK